MVVGLLDAGAAGYVVLTRNDTTDTRAAALAAARQYAVDLTTYDFASVDADLERFNRHGTKSFQATFASTIATAKPAILKAQSRALGSVVAAGVEAYAEDRVTVLLAVDQTLRSATQAGTAVERNRIRMTLERSGDGWLVSAVKVF